MSDCVCVCMCMNKEKAVHLKNYLYSLSNNNAQLNKTTNKLSISQTSSQQISFFIFILCSHRHQKQHISNSN